MRPPRPGAGTAWAPAVALGVLLSAPAALANPPGPPAPSPGPLDASLHRVERGTKADRLPSIPPAASVTPVPVVPSERPAMGLGPAPSVARHGPPDVVTRDAETAGGPGSFPPLVDLQSPLFDTDGSTLPPAPFEHLAPPMAGAPAPEEPDAASAAVPKGQVSGDASGLLPPAERLGLSGDKLARAEKCMAEAIYFESRGEPVRGQIAVAQVIVNRVFSGFYPADVCDVVYQNAHRRLACQFTFACDRVPDRVRSPRSWETAQAIARDMLAGRSWLDEVGKATHYHASYVRPNWIRDMNRIETIGVHTFYRPRNWQSWEGRS